MKAARRSRNVPTPGRKARNRKRRWRQRSRAERLAKTGTAGRRVKRNRFKERRLYSLSPLITRFPLSVDRLTRKTGRPGLAVDFIRKDKTYREALASTQGGYYIKPRNSCSDLAIHKNSRIAFAINLRALGFRKDEPNLPQIVFLAYLITLDGPNLPVARQINCIYGYLGRKKPHGFLRHLPAACERCWRFSQRTHKVRGT